MIEGAGQICNTLMDSKLRGKVPFIKKTYKIEKKIKSFLFLKSLGYSIKESQKFIDKNRLYQNNKNIRKAEFLEAGECELVEFIPFTPNQYIEVIEIVSIKI